jgi:hypothetical protein
VAEPRVHLDECIARPTRVVGGDQVHGPPFGRGDACIDSCAFSIRCHPFSLNSVTPEGLPVS